MRASKRSGATEFAIAAYMAQICAMNQFSSLPRSVDRYAPDGAYAFTRLAVSLLIATLIGAGMWAVIVVLPPAQLDFGVDRSAASLPYTLMMCSLAFSTIALGRMTDRFGIVLPLLISAVTMGVGFVLAGYAPEPGRVHRRPCADRNRRGNRLRADDGGHFALVRQAARASRSSLSPPAITSPERSGRF